MVDAFPPRLGRRSLFGLGLLAAAAPLPAGAGTLTGATLGRAGRVHIARDDVGQVWVGGDCVGVIRGEVNL